MPRMSLIRRLDVELQFGVDVMKSLDVVGARSVVLGNPGYSDGELGVETKISEEGSRVCR